MTEFVVRPAAESDLPELMRMAASIKGLTTLPHDAELLENKIIDSLKAFNPHVRKPGGEIYLFVIEDVSQKILCGTSAIVSKTGGFEPFYTYKITDDPHHCDLLNVHKKMRVLHFQSNHNGPTEIGALLVDPTKRHTGLGKLISLSRFLFMAEFPKRFDKTVISELRGVVTPSGEVPFWDCLGRHFFDTDFYTADHLTGIGKREFIEHLMPKYPVYVDLLPQAAQKCIGEVHPDTRPARHLLEEEGFRFEDEVDIFDAGPTLKCPLQKIRTIKESKNILVSDFKDTKSETQAALIANTSLDFRCIRSKISFDKNGKGILSEHDAELLKIKKDQNIRFIFL